MNRYANIIDNKQELNNYADFIASLTRTCPTNENVFSNVQSSLQQSETIQDYLPNRRSTKSVDRWDIEYNKHLASESIMDQTLYEDGDQKFNESDTSGCKISNNLMKNTNKKPILSGSKNRHLEIKAISPLERKNENIDRVFNDENSVQKPGHGFRTAASEYNIQNKKKYGIAGETEKSDSNRRYLGTLGPGPHSVYDKFKPPYEKCSDVEENAKKSDVHPALKNIDPKMIELIENEIMDKGIPICWDDVAGLARVKSVIQEIVVLPLLRPDIFTGIRRPPKGVLLFGPPGTGKTLIGKCVASQVKSTFFSISASSLTSKWIGESEKMVRALFAVARYRQPSVIFIDEIDSLLSQRTDTEHESSRRLKTEFLVQLDGATTGENDRILVIGATNRPQELDEAARRRFVKRLYIPLPDVNARSQIISRLMSTERNDLSDDDIAFIAGTTGGYSGADMANLCKEASLGPIRSIDISLIGTISLNEVRAINVDDFKSALNYVRSSVSSCDIDQCIRWDETYGSTGQRPI